MALQDEPTVWLALAIAAVAVVLMFRLSRKGPARPTVTHISEGGEVPEEQQGMLLQFVHDESGTRRGETVAVDGDQFVLKTPDGFALVSTAKVTKVDGTLRVAPDVDWPAARAAGESWRERSHKVIDYADDEVPKDEPENRS